MGLLSSRNGPSEGWFTLQDEPVHGAIRDTGESCSRPTRGRGLVKLVESPAQPLHSSASEMPAAVAGLNGTRLTRRSRLERWNDQATSVLSPIAASRFGALALSAVIVVLALAVMGLWASRGGSDDAVIQAYKTQVARLTTERDQAVGTATRAERANAAAVAELVRWRSLAIAEQRAGGVGRAGAGHNTKPGGSR